MMTEPRMPSGDHFGQRSPPLTVLISRILDRYPDGGQILKELIQNADDAGATKVKFLYDCHSFNTEHLVSPGLQKFQGPALYAYNDAMFQPDDWKGIQKLHVSNKENDPLKVGRFGIGFNSVYHITDLPGIASGDFVGFLDPHEKYFGLKERGKLYTISDGLLNTSLNDQFVPFHGVYHCDLSAESKIYDGTLFRFPLRTEPSELSKKIYTKRMIDGLFKSLHEEAPVILLFLKTVQSIAVEERKEDGNIELVFKVEVSMKTSEEVTRKRQELCEKALEPEVSKSQFVLDVEVTSNCKRKNFQWLVLNQIGSEDKRVTELAAKLRLLPWIGCAVPINFSNDEMTGRIFCFLPLPPDVDCETGLPVHLHGYFGMMDNRRGLIWRGRECQNNEKAEWNELLVKNVATEVYSNVFDSLVKNEPTTGLSEEQRCQLIYSIFPDGNKVRGHWCCILEPLLKELCDKKLFYCQSRESRWITLKEGILDQLQQSGVTFETRNALLKVLVGYGLDIITELPEHVNNAIDKYVVRKRLIDPVLVRNVLKNPDAKITSSGEKILLLDYVLSDSPTTDLSGVPLLPLQGGTFALFKAHSHASDPTASVFVPSEKCTAILLPNMSNRFLNGNLPKKISKKLHALAATENDKQNATQLTKLTKEIVIENLVDSLPRKWSKVIKRCQRDKVQWIPSDHWYPTEKWLESIWEWIHVWYPDSLAEFPRIPLIPLPTATDKCLGILSRDCKFIFASDSTGNHLPSPITRILIACGCSVIDNLPSFCYHPDIGTYIAPPTAAGTISVLCRASVETAQQHMKHMSSSDRSVVRKCFASLPENVTIDEKNFLLKLPLFDSLTGSSTAVQANGESLKAASSEFKNLPEGFHFVRGDELISTACPSSRQLLTLLSVEILKPAEVFVQYLFLDILVGDIYNRLDTSTIMLWTLRQLSIFKSQCQEFLEKMKIIPFVSTGADQLKKPSELYDPDDTVLHDLFSGEMNKFPIGDFAEENAVSALKELGLRTRKMLTPVELLGVARIISATSVSTFSIKKVQTLLNLLKGNLTYLKQPIDGETTLKDQLLGLKWLPCAKKPPKTIRFPKLMPWYKGDPALFKPTQLRSTCQALLIGSSMPTLDIEMDRALLEGFNLTSDPPLDQVVSQLQTAVRVWQDCRIKKVSFAFQEMLAGIYLHLSDKSSDRDYIAMNHLSLKQWIWHGNGFCSPAQMAFEKDIPLDLRPQLFLLPGYLQETPSLKLFFKKRGVRARFSEEDILGVLSDIRDKHNRLATDVCPKEVKRDLKLCRSILEWVVKDGETLSESLQEKVLVPVQSAKNVLKLEPCKNCTYCDRDWLRGGQSELDIPGDFLLIHNTVSMPVAILLGVPALSTCLLSADTLGFEQTGPYEPITTRLNNILNEYKEGVGVFKELIQNADDAGAHKLRFLVDWRHGPKVEILSPKMAECQGPALWAYNDALFTDKDFENINKLAGATKVEDLAKIGRFGLGFNTVYHLTDVPSFVSGEYMVIFDPNTNHLQDLIKDKSRPGILINLGRNPKPLSIFGDQFQPYHGIFDCRTKFTEGKKFYYDGTLFRFPFRTSRQANESSICQTVYDETKVKEIVARLKESASLLLLYTQHVEVIELYELGKDNTPEMMKVVFSVKRNVSQDSHSPRRAPFIEDCSNWWQRMLNSQGAIEATSPSRSELITINMEGMVSTLVGNTEKTVRQETWLVSSCVGSSSSVQLARGEARRHGLLPCAGAAARLSSIPDAVKDFGCRERLPIPEAVKGEAFCFLPLSYTTGLPVHINGYFAITSNRLGIWERNSSERSQPIEVQWNESLIEDALSDAYLQLLAELKRLSDEKRLKDYAYDVLWPCYSTLKSVTSWGALVKSVYATMVEKSLPLFRSNGKWLDIHSGYILGDELCSTPEVAKTLAHLKVNIFDMTPEIHSSLTKSGQGEVLKNRTLTLLVFFEEFFFPNISTIPHYLRDPIVLFGLDLILRKEGVLVSLFKENRCITCSADVVKLAKPCKLINPEGTAATLFSPEECRFPATKDFLTKKRLYVLEELGMVKDQLSWNEICGRAKSVERLAETSYEQALQRVQNLVTYLNGNIKKLQQKEKASEDVLETLQITRFLPFINKAPPEYTLPWKGSSLVTMPFFTPRDLFLYGDMHLVGSCCRIVHESNDGGCGDINERVQALLGFDDRRPNNDQVLQQLDIAIKCNADSRRAKLLIDCVCKKVYKHLNAFVSKKSTNNRLVTSLIQTLRGKKAWLRIQGKFVPTVNVAMDWKGTGAPFLYSLRDEYCGKYDHLLRAAGVKEAFKPEDFINALNSLRKSKKGAPLSAGEIKLTVSFVQELQETVKEHVGKIPLPDTKGVLCNSEELTINEMVWLKDRGDARYVHENIPPRLAMNLGVKLLLNRRRKKYAHVLSTPFGQHETLSNRIKSILKSYPCDSGILKELVQNADDAKATEIHFVYDHRHLPIERVIQDNVSEIHGPALCVYNNQPFSDEDLGGIQKLGIGSKADDPEKTGQYGIGFNAVYHLTDCPSFLSDDNTFCILDPHCRYAPDATQDAPGEQFKPIDKSFKEDFSDSLCGFLGEHFDLKGSTMFRLPLRTAEQSRVSLISQNEVNDNKMKELLTTFRKEAKKMLLFLNFVKKISISEMDAKANLTNTYWVESSVDKEDVEKRRKMVSFMKKYKTDPTGNIPWNGTTYSITISDSKRDVEEWLVHQCCGIKREEEDKTVIDGRPWGLFPRGGIAALISPFTPAVRQQYVAYCFLPLPVDTCLPVHVNGHFALNPSRRALWTDVDQERPLTKWNNLMKSRVLAPGYATLVSEARNFIPHCKKDGANDFFFHNWTDAEEGLNWYHGLFPDFSKSDREWGSLVIEFYRCLAREETLILPVVAADEEIQTRTPNSAMVPRRTRSTTRKIADNSTPTTTQRTRQDPKSAAKSSLSCSKVLECSRTSQSTQAKSARISLVSSKRQRTEPFICIREWLPVQKSFFREKSNSSSLLYPVLLRIGMPLLMFSPLQIYDAFVKADAPARLISPMEVIDFLLTFQSNNSNCTIGKLPKDLKATNIKSELNLQQLIAYCKKGKKFSERLQGLPLLLTADKQLRMFDSSNPVFLSGYSDLVPAKADQFVHPNFVGQLLYATRESDDEQLPQVMVDLTVSSLASFMPDLFSSPTFTDCTRHVSWAFPEQGVLSELWFMRLWEFLQNDAKPEKNESKVSLFTMSVWPIIPTLCGKLVTINNGKSVLDVTELKTENAQGQNVLRILKKMNCPSLHKDIVYPLTEKHVPSVLDPHVAHYYSASDVLHVLDYMQIDVTTLLDDEIIQLLCFLQDGIRSFNDTYVKILKTLPFYKAIDGSHCALSAYSSLIVVPKCIPIAGLEKLKQRLGNKCLFLHPDPTLLLSDLYKLLKINECTFYEFYKNYILRYFDIFNRNCQIEYLAHIKELVLSESVGIHDTIQDFLSVLRSTPCIPDETGKLHLASKYYDSRNKVFQIMLDPTLHIFPSAPFNETPWFRFLEKIGMRKDVDDQQFLDFCREVEKAAKSQDDETNTKRSKVLVEYLFNLRQPYNQRTHRSISNIRFICPDKVEDSLFDLHKQHNYNEAGEKLRYIQFYNSIPWKYRDLVWTSAELLPGWAQPVPSFQAKNYLQIEEKPRLKNVISHLEILSSSTISKCDNPTSQQCENLKKVLVSIYKFLDCAEECASKEVSDSCCATCKTIGVRLKSVCCVLIEDENVLVKGDQLAFSVPLQGRNLQPFFYSVPLDYGIYQHFLQRIGTTAHVTSFQMATVLKAIKDCFQDDPASVKKSSDAMFLLFQAVVTDADKNVSKISQLTELYLLSEEKRLVKSTELVCDVSPRLMHAVTKQNYHVLFPLEKCGLPRARESEYLQALPEHLRPRSLETLVLEEFDPSCREETCIYDQGNCTFIEKYILVLRSSQFRQGIIRLMKHQKKSNELTEDEKKMAARFSLPKEVVIQCMKTIKTHLVNMKTQKPLEKSSCERTCYVTRENHCRTLYIQHEFGGSKTQAILSKSVNEIIEGCIEGTCIAELTDMLLCDMPSEIPGVLDIHDISHDYSEEDEDLGREIPAVYHYLVQQNPLCTFNEGDRVAYSVDTLEDWNEEDGVTYKLAKITKRIHTKTVKEAEYDFQAEYWLDVGSETKRVSVLDLYNFKEDLDEDLTTSPDLCEGSTSSMYINVDKEKRDLHKVLRAARRLSLKMRRKVLRRLYLHWLQTKNSGNTEAVIEIIKCLETEVKRLEDEMDSTDGFHSRSYRSYRPFKFWERQATREEETFHNFRSSFSGSLHSFPSTSDYTCPEPEEALRWIEQSQADLQAAKFLHSNVSSFHAYVCFFSEQVVEKCLKAALYARCGLRRQQLHTHDVVRLARDVKQLSQAPTNEVDLAVNAVANYYLPTRYPNRQPRGKVPANEFSKEQADEAWEVANGLLNGIKTFIVDTK